MCAFAADRNVVRGLSSPVIVPAEIDWHRDYSKTTLGELVGMTDEELATVDPLAMNLIVAKGVPALADLEIWRYQEIVNALTWDFSQRCLPQWEPHFHLAPEAWRNDARFLSRLS
jgi:hypothetical protein